MDNFTDINFPVVEASYSLSYLLIGVKLLGTIVVFSIGKMLKERPE